MLIRYRKSKKTRKQIPPWHNLVIAGLSGVIVRAVFQPMNVLKTRMQLRGVDGINGGLIKTTSNILKCEGVTGFYRGLTAAMLRQATYTSARMACYHSIYEMFKRQQGASHPPSFYEKVQIGTLAGGIAAFISTPAEVALVRTVADARLPICQRRNYRHVFHALSKIVRDDGVTTLWRGACTTTTKAVIVNGIQLSTYKESRDRLRPHLSDGMRLYFAASLIAAFVATVASLPVDIIKTRVQYAEKLATSQFRMLMSIIRREGILTLWTGFLPAYCKSGPSTILVFLLMEQIKNLYTKLTSEEPKSN